MNNVESSKRLARDDLSQLLIRHPPSVLYLTLYLGLDYLATKPLTRVVFDYAVWIMIFDLDYIIQAHSYYFMVSHKYPCTSKLPHHRFTHYLMIKLHFFPVTPTQVYDMDIDIGISEASIIIRGISVEKHIQISTLTLLVYDLCEFKIILLLHSHSHSILITVITCDKEVSIVINV